MTQSTGLYSQESLRNLIIIAAMRRIFSHASHRVQGFVNRGLAQSIPAAALLMLFAIPTFGQGVPYENFLMAANGPQGSLVPVSFATITVCAGVHAEIPCTPAVTIYSDVALTQVITPPLTSGPLGNYRFVLAPGTYSISFTGPGISAPNDVIVLGGGSNAAYKYVAADAVRYVSTTGNDSNDGLSPGTAKATITGAYSTLPTCTPIPSLGQSTSPTAPCGTINIAAGTFAVSSGITINGLMVRIVGMGKAATTINCTGAITCFTFNNQSPYAFAPTMSVEGGLYYLTLNGDGSANQLGVFCKTCDGGIVRDVRFSNFSGTSANAFEFLNDATGGITERNDWNDVAFDNNTNGILMTTTGATNNTSFGHNAFRHVQWSLANGQTAWTLGGSGTNGGAGLYGSYIDGLINAADSNPAHNATAIAITGTAKVLGNFRLIIDNGAGLTIAPCSGCTTTNFVNWGFVDGAAGFDATNGNLTTYNSGIRMNASSSAVGSGPAWYLNDAIKFHADLDGSGFLEFTNTSANSVFGLTQTGIVSQPGLQIFSTGTTCTTGATVGAICTTGAITLPAAEPDTSYRVVCVGKGITNVPVVVATTNSSATQFTITIAALTAAAATFTSYDCMAGHN